MAEHLFTKEEVEASKGATGRIVRIVGPVVDVEFPPDQLPAIYNALTVDAKTEAGDLHVVLEVETHLPGNIVGMVLLLVLLGTGLLKARHVGDACDCLLDNMSLFFIPAGVAILGCVSLLEGNAAKFALVCVVTTVLVFLATAYTVMLVSRLMAKRDARTADEEA